MHFAQHQARRGNTYNVPDAPQLALGCQRQRTGRDDGLVAGTKKTKTTGDAMETRSWSPSRPSESVGRFTCRPAFGSSQPLEPVRLRLPSRNSPYCVIRNRQAVVQRQHSAVLVASQLAHQQPSASHSIIGCEQTCSRLASKQSSAQLAAKRLRDAFWPGNQDSTRPTL